MGNTESNETRPNSLDCERPSDSERPNRMEVSKPELCAEAGSAGPASRRPLWGGGEQGAMGNTDARGVRL